MQNNNCRHDKPAVVAVGLYVSGTGFTRVLETLFAELSVQFEIHWLGIGHKAGAIKKEHYTLHPVNKNGGDIYGAYAVAALAKEINAQNILLLTDFYLLKNYQRPLEPLQQAGVRLLAYVPIDGYFTDTAIAGQCLFLDELVLYNQWAMQEVEDAIKQYKAAANKIGHAQPVLSYIYHGTDTDSFSIAAVNKTRQQLTTELFAVPDAANSIFILNANRYNERKDIASTITAFAAAVPLFNRRAYLCLHTPNLQTELEAQLRSQIASSDYKESILLNPLGPGYCSNEQLAGLYIACDIGINTSHGEGWGMISFEHAACGAAQLVPGYTSPGELWKDIAVLLPAQKSIQLSTNPFLMCCVNTGVLTDKLVQLVNNETYRNTISANCKQHVHNDIFNWKIIAAQWAEKLSCGKEGKIINMYQ